MARKAKTTYENCGVSLDALEATGWRDPVGRKLAMTAQNICGVIVPGESNTGRDFWLAEHAERIAETVSGLAFTATQVAAHKPAERERLKGTIDRQREITARFVHYVTNLQPFTLEYRPDMGEAELRRWAAGVFSALQGE